MPKKPIDFSRTVIYKICCKDISVKDEYVGSTTDLVKRRTQHKNFCVLRENLRQTKLPVYNFIRAHGGWANWEAIQVEEFPCKTSEQQRTRERYWLELLGATLNSVNPIETKADKALRDHNYYTKNAPAIKANMVAYYNTGEHRAKAIERSAEFYQLHRTEILNRNALEVPCECGIHMTRSNLPRHKRSARHLAAMANLTAATL